MKRYKIMISILTGTDNEKGEFDLESSEQTYSQIVDHINMYEIIKAVNWPKDVDPPNA